MRRRRRTLFFPHTRRRAGLSGAVDPEDPCERFIRLRMVEWERRRLRAKGRLLGEDLRYLGYLLGMGHQELMDALDVEWEPEMEDADDEESVDLALCRELHRSGTRRWPQQLEAAFPRCLRALGRRRRVLRQRRRPEIARNMNRLRRLFGLSKTESEAVLLLYAAAMDHLFGHLFEEATGWERRAGAIFLAVALGIERVEATHILRDRLPALGMQDPCDQDLVCLPDEVLDLVEDPDPDRMGKGMFGRSPRERVPLSAHTVDPEDVACLQSLLARRPAGSGTHVLLHGPPGTGKTTFARGLGQMLGSPVYEVAAQEDSRVASRRLAIVACINATCGEHAAGGGAIIIVDEADSILNTGALPAPGISYPVRMGGAADKGWLTQLMDRSGMRMIWIVNSVGGVHPAVKRRFAHNLEFRPLRRDQRARIWGQVLRRHGARRLVSAGEVKRLAGEYDLGVGAISLAVSKAREAAGNRDREAFLATTRRLLDGHHALLAGTTLQPRAREHVGDRFTLDGLEVAGLDRTLARLDRFDRHLRGGGEDPSQMTMLFYGPPGTGKSEMARYMAERVDRHLVVKRASDLLGPYVGQTEQAIAGAFQEAEDREAVLAIDEADSLLFPRGRATRSWEVSFTNQMLASMEHHRGVLIFTTNRFGDLDEASVRRFSAKLKFDHLAPDGVEVFYHRLLGDLCEAPMGARDRAALRAVRNLAPGDFSNVREQFVFEEPAGVTHGVLVEALARETRLKRRGRGRRAGF